MLHKWVVYRMNKKRFGNIYRPMGQELSATEDGESVIVDGDLD